MSVSEAANTSNPNAKQGDPTQEEKLAVVCILSVLSVFGTCGNGLVLYVFSSKGNKVTSTIFILALAGTDFITCLFHPTDGGQRCRGQLLLLRLRVQTVPIPHHVQRSLGGLHHGGHRRRPYFSICHPFLHAVTPCRARVTVFLLCVFAFVLGTITAMGHSTYNYVNVTGEELNVAGAPPSSVEPSSGETRWSFLETRAHPRLYESGRTPTTCRRMCVSSWCSQARVTWCSCFSPASSCTPIRRSSLRSISSLSSPSASSTLSSIAPSCSAENGVDGSARVKPSRSAPTLTTEVEDIELRSKNGTENGGVNETQSLNSSEKKANKERRDFNFLANIRTAAMLFVVTLVFIIAFLPSWLMAVQLVDYKVIVFYCYFVYNVANPVIYAFMNHAFRKELKRVFQRGTNCFVCKPRLYS
ncbi:hypothetical protein C0Q70_03964 [Pomacea canaliculata]|uniref:G-protein coupled receptors family 1 profile domain-containing protein n=1 Tax=Pomacea canaliculata TaxID=400727 RepID=A0A2T7PU66_POMCA|nr:uncharacterized protein LOC112557727 [Pomacea canaliculata]XP_025083517.1 uncharacterized protein LOC112557727 [Pomacea canaliculata]XP_025083518.1 uncharacterized protein LOC112557727 [Pomacea canaliculata]XP_025083520.1 uncharacterized protein LOC112557727 [Pomacea canaliculata]PVD36971.1 hypothetical protein C0Q70_03964 [Pomacea canaliculata]